MGYLKSNDTEYPVCLNRFNIQQWSIYRKIIAEPILLNFFAGTSFKHVRRNRTQANHFTYTIRCGIKNNSIKKW